MAKLSVDELLDGIKELSVIEAADLATKMQEEFGIEAAAPAMAAAGVAAPAEAVEEKDEYDVVITSAGDKKIQVIKEVRAHTQLGLKEAKELVDNAPNAVKEGIPKDEAEKIRSALEEAGASVELK